MILRPRAIRQITFRTFLFAIALTALSAGPAIASGFRAGSDGPPTIDSGFRAGGGVGASFVRQQFEEGGNLSVVSFMMHSGLEYGGRFRYVGRFSYGVPLYSRIQGERLSLERESRSSATADTFHGGAMVFSPRESFANGMSQVALIPAIGVGANLTYVRPEDAAQGPAPVTAVGPAFEGAFRVTVSERISVGISSGAMVGVFTVDMAENRFGPSGVDAVVAVHVSPGLTVSF